MSVRPRPCAHACWHALLLALLAFAPGVASSAGSEDPGITLEIAAFALHSVDRSTGEEGPPLPVAMGSPGQPTPRGVFPLHRVILRPRWNPGIDAARAGAEPEPASTTSPMGVAKIPFADHGAVALHGGGHPRLLGKPVSSGCVRTSDAGLLRLIAWLDLRGALGPPVPRDGEVHRAVVRPTRLIVGDQGSIGGPPAGAGPEGL